MIGKLISRMMSATGPSTALQETLYGFIMALIFAYGARFGLIEFSDKGAFAITVTGMCLTWGVIDGIIFYYIWYFDARRQSMIVSNTVNADRGSRLNEVLDYASGTILDILSDKDKTEMCDRILDMGVQSQEEFEEDKRAMIRNSVGCVFFGVIGLVPILLPLIFFEDLIYALGISCLLSGLSLFVVGYLMGPYLGLGRFITGAFLAGISLVISVISVFTGGRSRVGPVIGTNLRFSAAVLRH